ncbi:MAG: hypothetical protein LBL46_01590, partial [Rickettsiales bacterium]|nr:hypothetical protein [Rickettsiales bacterium]
GGGIDFVSEQSELTKSWVGVSLFQIRPHPRVARQQVAKQLYPAPINGGRKSAVQKQKQEKIYVQHIRKKEK